MHRDLRAIALLTTAVMAFAVVAPAAATAPGPVGVKIPIIIEPPPTFPAGQAFHVSHGWRFIPEERPIAVGSVRFDLEIDGVLQEPDLVRTSHEVDLARNWIYNFPAGLPAGEHELRGLWYGPCRWGVDRGWYTGECATPNEAVVLEEHTRLILFEED